MLRRATTGAPRVSRRFAPLNHILPARKPSATLRLCPNGRAKRHVQPPLGEIASLRFLKVGQVHPCTWPVVSIDCTYIKYYYYTYEVNMETKLTLKLDETIIDQAKKYAFKRKKSLSRLVEDYFKELGSDEFKQTSSINPIVKELSGIISINDVTSFEDDYESYLEKKYE